MPFNKYHQEIGEALPNYREGDRPHIKQLVGDTVIVEPLSEDKHMTDAYTFYGPSSPKEQWTYTGLEGFEDRASFEDYFRQMIASKDPYYLAIVSKETGKIVGTFSLMRITPQHRVMEMGWVLYSEVLKQSRLATEAQYLVMRYVFETLGYRRYEWKCDSLNAPSNHAAKRLGFQYEGTFRSAIVYKGRNRDTNWYAMIREDYEQMKPKFENWLQADNFDDTGKQLKRLIDC